MAWNACKVEAINTIKQKVEEVGSVRAACKAVSEESDIPASTLRDWYKYPEGRPPVGEDSPVKQKAGEVLPDKTEGTTPQSAAWVSVARRLGTLEKFMRKNCEMPVEIDVELRTIIKERIDFIEDAMGEGDA